MVNQYPHTLVVTNSAASTQDAEGDWVIGSDTTVELACRAEPNKGNGFIFGDDGNRIYYAWIVYLPLPVEEIKIGTKVRVKDATTDLSNNEVLRFSKGQLNARLWL